VVTSLRESDGVDLHQALRALDPGLPKPIVAFELDEQALVPNIRHAEAILRCAQEGLTNALRHSGAERVLVALRDSVEGLTLSVEDDGNGPDGDWELGNGLRGLRERLQQLGGRVDIEARRPQGIVLRAILPHDVVNV
jgi:signal transduction histidine kinase